MQKIFTNFLTKAVGFVDNRLKQPKKPLKYVDNPVEIVDLFKKSDFVYKFDRVLFKTTRIRY
ncbi:hypothetical protein Tfer_1502 [Thermincola ferriacetica]|uniref:Uncharacterized protein n=1 Tax=Thermincola ferriacetica TaxID=281456 RepID=A0A0L6W2W7_9FIRM|nr:hypothetical protein Tfer_1502 [Thermincola ferriacetica]